MNYEAHYNTLIERAQTRLLECYTEQHHVIPVCMGGSNDDDNLVRLTPEEHYVAHQLLVKMCPNEPKLVYAAHMMGGTRKGNKIYGWLKQEYAKTVSEQKMGVPLSEEHKAKIGEGGRGRKHSAATKAKMSISSKGHKRNLGLTHSNETKRKISESMKRARATT